MWIHAYVHKNPPPVLVLSFKCAEIDVLGTPDFLDAAFMHACVKPPKKRI
jgi:hypothetical protein